MAGLRTEGKATLKIEKKRTSFSIIQSYVHEYLISIHVHETFDPLTSQNVQIHFNNLAAFAAIFLKCV